MLLGRSIALAIVSECEVKDSFGEGVKGVESGELQRLREEAWKQYRYCTRKMRRVKREPERRQWQLQANRALGLLLRLEKAWTLRELNQRLSELERLVKVDG